MVALVAANMFAIKDLRLNFWELSLYSKLIILPLRLNQNAGFSVAVSPWRRVMARLHFLLFVAQVANVNYTLLRSLLYPEYFKVRHFIFHLTLELGSCVGVLWHFMYWIQWPMDSSRLFNFSFPSTDLKLSEGTCVQRRTKLGWLTLCMPIIGAATLILVVGICLYEPSISILRFYGTADDTSWRGYFSIFLTSGTFMLYVVSSLIPIITMQLLFLENTMEKLHKILQL